MYLRLAWPTSTDPLAAAVIVVVLILVVLGVMLILDALDEYSTWRQ